MHETEETEGSVAHGRSSLRVHFDWVAKHDRRPRRFQAGFHRLLRRLFKRHVEAKRSVLECGCGRGELLRALDPVQGLGVDISGEMLAQAAAASADGALRFVQADLHELSTSEAFDYVVLDYLAGYLIDLQGCFERIHRFAHSRTRLCITSLNTTWLPLLNLGRRLGLVTRQPPSNWLSTKDLVNLLELAGWEVVQTTSELLLPFDLPVLDWIFNRFLVRLPVLRQLGSTLFIVARPKRPPALTDLTCSVIVPARNEAGNILAAIERIPRLGKTTEIIFVEGNSSDNTWDTIQQEIARYRGTHVLRGYKQPGRGKWDAVREGFARASGDVVVIQDADLTAPPEDLPKFFEAIAAGTVEFANGSRLVYPMEGQAMQFLNLVGNKCFAIALSYVLGQPIKDSLCGTKMCLRSDYLRIMDRIKFLGDFDPFGDFNLLFGAALLDLRIRDIPVRYAARTYGETNISRFKHGWILIKMTLFGLFKIKFS